MNDFITGYAHVWMIGYGALNLRARYHHQNAQLTD
jgi:hypothetical protein